MARRALGTLRKFGTGWTSRIRVDATKCGEFPLRHCRTEAEARERHAALANIAVRVRRAGEGAQLRKLLEMAADAPAGRQLGAVMGAVDLLCAGTTAARSDVPTFEQFAIEWTSGRLHKKFPDRVPEKRSSTRDEQLLRLYVYPVVGSIRVDQFTLDDADRVLDSLPSISAYTRRPMAPATRRHVAQVVARVLHLAKYPGKYRPDSLIPRGCCRIRGPRRRKSASIPTKIESSCQAPGARRCFVDSSTAS